MNSLMIEFFGNPILIEFEEIVEIDGVFYQITGTSGTVIETNYISSNGKSFPCTDTYFWCDVLAASNDQSAKWLNGRRKIEVQGSVLAAAILRQTKTLAHTA